MLEPFKIETIAPIDVYCVRHVGDYNKIGEAYKVLMGFIYTQKIKYKKNLMGKDAFSYGIAYDDPNVTDIDKLRSDACVSATDELELPNEIRRCQIAGGKYAVFLHKGAYINLKESYAEIYAWVKYQGIIVRDVPSFEKYLNRNPNKTKPENLKTEIYLPIE